MCMCVCGGLGNSLLLRLDPPLSGVCNCIRLRLTIFYNFLFSDVDDYFPFFWFNPCGLLLFPRLVSH